MNATSTPHSMLFTIAIAALLGWRIYMRIRRLVGRQRLSPVRPWVTLLVFPLLLCLLAFVSLGHPYTLAALGGGLALGIGLGLYGHRLTRFEATPEGLFYTPNAHLGIALSLLFIGRCGYRMIQLSMLGETGSMNDFGGSPITLAIFATLAGYYVSYAAGLLRWKHSVRRSSDA